MTLTGRGTSTTGPAKFEIAEIASHVIASLVFLDLRAAHRAEGHIIFVLLSPALQLILHGLLAAQLPMPLISALEADFSAAFGAYNL